MAQRDLRQRHARRHRFAYNRQLRLLLIYAPAVGVDPPDQTRVTLSVRRFQGAHLQAGGHRPAGHRLRDAARSAHPCGDGADRTVTREQTLQRYNWILGERTRIEQERAEAAEKAAQEAREAARRLEQERVDLLLRAVANIERAAAIRRLVAVLGERLEASGKSTSEANLWAAWASAYADRIDPLLMSAETAVRWFAAFRLGG